MNECVERVCGTSVWNECVERVWGTSVMNECGERVVWNDCVTCQNFLGIVPAYGEQTAVLVVRIHVHKVADSSQ
jgi:hypothetical protein